MDQENDYENYEEEPEEFEEFESDDQVTVAPPLEGPIAKYMREYRLLNSLLISLASILAFFVAMWNIVVYVAASGEGDLDFSDAGAAPAQQQQEKQKVVKLMQRQQKAQPKSQQTFRTTAISDITLPDMNELDVKEDTVREMEQRMSSHDVSFDPYSADDSEEGNTYSPADYLTNEDSDPMEIVEKEDFARDQINQLQSAISDLDERSQLILKERWLTDDKPTLHELADKYGISAERIRQIEKKAMEKIRTNIN